MKRLNDNRFYVLGFHLRDHFSQVRRRGRNARLWFEENIDIQSKAMREVRPGIVISDNVLAMKRQQRSAPFLQLCVDRGFKLLVVSLIKCSIGRIQSGKRLRNMLSD